MTNQRDQGVDLSLEQQGVVRVRALREQVADAGFDRFDGHGHLRLSDTRLPRRHQANSCARASSRLAVTSLPRVPSGLSHRASHMTAILLAAAFLSGCGVTAWQRAQDDNARLLQMHNALHSSEMEDAIRAAQPGVPRQPNTPGNRPHGALHVR